MGTFKIMFVLLACVCAAVLCFPERPQAHSLNCATTGAMQKSSQGASDSAVNAHIPPAGSPERKDIMDGLRGDQKVIFKVHYLKVHGDWAFVDVTLLDDKGKPVAEGGASLMHKENGAWKVMDLSVLPEDPDNPMGLDDPTPKFVKGVQKAFPGVPSDIFPPRARPK
jgi:hypothetical protein